MKVLALRSRPAGGGFKPPHAALAEDRRGERCGKGAVGGVRWGIGKASASESLRTCRKRIRRHRNWGCRYGSRTSLADTRLLARRCPAWRRRESDLRHSRGTWEGGC